MLDFLDSFVSLGYAGEILENLINELLYDNPLVIFLWVFIIGFGLRVILKAFFG